MSSFQLGQTYNTWYYFMEYLPWSVLFFIGKGNINPTEIDYKRKETVAILLVVMNEFVRLTHTKQKLMPNAKLHAHCSYHVPQWVLTLKIQIKLWNTYSAGYLQSIIANSKFSVVGGKNGTFPEDMAGCLVRPLQASLVLRELFLCDFALMRLENLHHFWNSHVNFWFNMIWQRRSVAALIFCRRQAENKANVMPSVTCMDWLHCSYNHVAHVVSSSTAMAFFKKKRNLNLHDLVQSKWKLVEDNWHWREIRRNKSNCRKWTNCWHMPQ